MQYEGKIGTIGVVLRRFRAVWKEKGFLRACWMISRLVLLVLLSPVFAITRGRRTFTFRGRDYRYVCHWYNTTFDNERAVELALAIDALRSAQGKRVLEIGNVLSHYVTARHNILDKYEKGVGVMNEDIVGFRPPQPYDLIVSLSTIEHVGLDEQPQDLDKILRAEKSIRRILAPGGRALITIPVGYNPHADRLLQSGKLFPDQAYLKRISHDNRWVETTKEEAFAASYDSPWSFGNALVVCTIQKSSALPENCDHTHALSRPASPLPPQDIEQHACLAGEDRLE